MKFLKTLITLTTLGFISTAIQASELEFTISGINSNNGKLYIQLFSGEENYQLRQAEASSIVKANKGVTTVSFNNIKEGEYAVRFFHDENDNGELETNLFGMPTEGYGFSNNAKPNFGPASYQEIKFIVSTNNEKTINKSTVIY